MANPITCTFIYIYIANSITNGAAFYRRTRISITTRGRCGRIAVTTTYAVSAYPAHGEVYSIQHNLIKFVSDLRQVGGSLRLLRFSLSIKLAATI